ncbi:MAG TPA: hypothetical protein VGL71_04050, partial [Urbifossiella sp.]
DVTAGLTFERIPLGALAAAVPGSKLAASGQISGQAKFQAPFAKISDPTTWNASASIKSDDFAVMSRHAKNLAIAAEIARGTATLTQASVAIEGIPISGSGTLALTGKYAFSASLRTVGTNVSDLSKLVPEAKLPVSVEGVFQTDSKVAGTLSPLAFTASGQVSASKMTLAKTPANHIDVNWELTQDQLKIPELSANLFNGSVNGSLDYPFDTTKTGTFAVSFKNLDASAAASLVPTLPLRITGDISGKVGGDIPAAKNGETRIGRLNLDLTAPKLTVQGIGADRLVGKAAIKNGVIDYSLEGKTLGGSFEVKGQYPGEAKPEPAGLKAPRGSLRLTDLNLAQLGSELKMRALAPLRGRLDLTFDFDNDLANGAGRIVVRDFGWGDNEIAHDISGLILLRDRTLEVRDFAGMIARGVLKARARVNVDNPARNFVVFSIDRADAARLLAPIPQLKGQATGEISMTLRGTVGRSIHGSGVVSIANGTIAGAEVEELRVPFDYSVGTASGRIAIHDAVTRAGSGRLTSSITVDWGSGTRLVGQVKFLDLPLKAISPAIGKNSFLGNGKITGRFDVAGKNIRGIDDLTGTLVARLNNTSVREVPLLQQTVPYLNPIGVTKPFQSGDIRGTLSAGLFRVQRLALANPSAQVFAEGTVRTTGQLDLDVVAHTGQIGPNVGGLALLGLRLPAI